MTPTAPVPSRSFERLQGLLGIVAAVGAVDLLAGTLEVVAEHALQAAGGATLSIHRLLEDGSGLEAAAVATHLAFDSSRVRPGHVTRFSDHPGLECQVLGGADILPADGGASITMPILVAGSVWGAVIIEDMPGQRFTDGDIEFLYAVCGHIADAIVEAQRAAETSRQAWLDPLTGLGNRRRLEAALAAALNSDNPATQPVSVVLIDVDDLKGVNDVAGHAAGDDLLCRTAAVLTGIAASRPGVTACRTGGDEFCLVFVGTPAREAARMVEDAFRKPSATAAPIRVSGGSCSSEEGLHTREDLLIRADEALYRAKQTSRGLVLVAESGAAPAAIESTRGRRRFRDRQASPVESVVLRGQQALAGSTELAERVTAAASVVAEALNALSIVVTVATPDGDRFLVDTRTVGHGSPLPAGPMSELPGLQLEVADADASTDPSGCRPAAVVGRLRTAAGDLVVHIELSGPGAASAAAVAAVEMLLMLASH